MKKYFELIKETGLSRDYVETYDSCVSEHIDPKSSNIKGTTILAICIKFLTIIFVIIYNKKLRFV